MRTLVDISEIDDKKIVRIEKHKNLKQRKIVMFLKNGDFYELITSRINENQIEVYFNKMERLKDETKYVEFEELKGKSFISIQRIYHDDYEKLLFIENNGNYFEMFHEQECCESVLIEDITGDIRDLLFHNILEATESSKIAENEDSGDHETWTFYKLATMRGWVDIRWYGSSNGYYSEEVEIKYTELAKNRKKP